MRPMVNAEAPDDPDRAALPAWHPRIQSSAHWASLSLYSAILRASQSFPCLLGLDRLGCAFKLFAPHFRSELQPVLSPHLGDPGPRPAGLVHRGGQIREITDYLHARWVNDVTEFGELTSVTLVVGNPFEEGTILALGEVGANASLICGVT